jgi:tRNA (guanine37-N1)-methyltransferase
MRFDIISIFPEFFNGPLDYGIVRRAREAGLVDVFVKDLRECTRDRHHTVDDRPFGGGEGMVLKPEPLFEAVEEILGRKLSDAENCSSRYSPGPEGSETAIVLLSASGKLFRQEEARRFAQLDRIILICGRYEGVDERVAEHLATEEISIGDYVLTGGELPAALVVDAVTRLIPGALGNEQSAVHESFSELPAPPAPRMDYAAGAEPRSKIPMKAAQKFVEPLNYSRGLLDYPHYTRPPDYRGWTVPEVLLSGNHEEIRRWRHKKALEKTLRNRPDLLHHSN